MKAIFTLVTTILVLSISSMAGSTKSATSYYICEFSDSIPVSEIKALYLIGFKIINTDTENGIIYLNGLSESAFPEKLKQKLKKLILVDQNGNKTYLINQAGESPQFLKLLFNFI